jgi:hypothetical protein
MSGVRLPLVLRDRRGFDRGHQAWSALSGAGDRDSQTVQQQQPALIQIGGWPACPSRSLLYDELP